jgi:hypothetical protein
MVVYVYNCIISATLEAEVGGASFEASLGSY